MGNDRIKVFLLASAGVVSLAAAVYAQVNAQQNSTRQEDKSATSCPMMQGGKSSSTGDSHEHAGHLAGVNARGEKAMGFSQTETTHHFLLMRDGGAIQVEANAAGDTANRDKIRGHLAHIAQMFSAADFNTPLAVHDRIPPGVPVMQRLKAEIRYRYEDTETGGRVRISTNNREALDAIHEFLRFQIKDHQTGDPLEVK
ncbi:MAG TPA: hypothetical protein VFX96_08740 [Pyrinomonadaceae bacterium]|nr:hypothetical protein [Pyrinomonadaceae bacterium]